MYFLRKAKAKAHKRRAYQISHFKFRQKRKQGKEKIARDAQFKICSALARTTETFVMSGHYM